MSLHFQSASDGPAGAGQRRVARVAIIASPDKPGAADALARMRAWLAGRAHLVFAESTYDSHPALAARPDLLFVLGGDGTLIAAVNGLGPHQIPVVGVNLGKIGYLADFTVDELEREGQFLFSGELPITRRIMMEVAFEHADGTRTRRPAINDCVILAGPPFHMITLTLAVDADELAEIRGDGLIVATASGSTAHNLAAGGPILEPTGEAFIVTPICPQALTFRPVVMDARRKLTIRVVHANAGTSVAADGRVMPDYRPGDVVHVSRYGADFLLVRNPRHSEWHALRRKLRWGEGPNIQPV